MAIKKDEAAVVEVADSDVVTVDISDNPELETADTGKDEVKEPKVRVSPEPKRDTKKADEASAALKEAVSKAETEATARRAAEATATAERTRANEAQRQLDQQRQESQSYKERAENNELTIINSGIDSATRELAAYEDEFAREAEAGEFKKMAAVQIKISKAAAALKGYEDAKVNFEVNSERKTAEGRVEAPQVQNQLENYLSGFAPRAQQFLRNHLDYIDPRVGGDRIKNNKLMSGHHSALAQGHSEGSDEYYRVLEESIGEREPVVKTEEEVDDKSSKRVAQVSAPVTRDPPAADGSQRARNVREVRLSKDQQDAARISFPTMTEQQAFAQYARNLIELEAEGKIGRVTH